MRPVDRWPPEYSPDDEDPWLTVPEVGAQLKLHPATIRSWIKSGRLAAVRAGRTWRVRRSDVDRALMADRSRSDASSSPSPESPGSESWRTPAPRQIADHILAVAPAADS